MVGRRRSGNDGGSKLLGFVLVFLVLGPELGFGFFFALFGGLLLCCVNIVIGSRSCNYVVLVMNLPFVKK